MKEKKKIVIVGGGISGMATAYRLSELSRAQGIPVEITVVEAGSRLGGVIESKRQDGFLLEGGPDSFISEKPAAQELAKRLGIANEIIGTNDKFRRSFIYKKGNLIPVPEGFYLIAPSQIRAFLQTHLLDWRTKFRMGCEVFIPKRSTNEDESVANFVRRRFGKATLEEVAQPMIGGIYTADPEYLSLEATMPQFLELERTYGSVIKGLLLRRNAKRKNSTQSASGPRYSLFLSFKEGMKELVDSVVKNSPDVRFKLNATAVCVTRMSRSTNPFGFFSFPLKACGYDKKTIPPTSLLNSSRNQCWQVDFENGATLEADAVCIALSACQAAPLVISVAPHLAKQLAAIPYESVATVNLAYKRSDIPHKLDGFGFVVPAITKRKIVACSFSSVKFDGRAPGGMVLLRVFVGGAFHREIYALDDNEMTRTVTDELRHYLGIEKLPLFTSISRYPRTMPQYQVGHLDMIRSIQAQLSDFPGLYLTGNAYRGIGVPDCIKWAESAAEAMYTFLKEKRKSADLNSVKGSSK